MILEVNNTFDEKRVYFLKRPKDKNTHLEHKNGDSIVTTPPTGEVLPNETEAVPAALDELVHSPPAEFKTTWAKDFHVSPFNSREGNYSLKANDPLSPSMRGSGLISNTITLSSSRNHTTLVARVFSTQPSLDPSSLSLIEEIRIVAGWWWVGLVTFPRILREAAKLFSWRKLEVWYRPEVLRGSIGRRETHDER